MKLVLFAVSLAGAPDVALFDRLNAAATACDFRQADAYVVSDVRSDQAARLSFDACADGHRRAVAALLVSPSEEAVDRIVAGTRRKLLPTLTQYIVQRRRQLMRRSVPPSLSKPHEQSL